MRRWMILPLLLLTLGLELAPTPASARRVVVVRHRGRRGHVNRVRVVVRPGFPLRRTLPLVVVRPPRVAAAVAVASFAEPVVWVIRDVERPREELFRKEDSESLDPEDDWSEVTLNVDERGDQLFLEVTEAPAEVSFAEVVFANGEARVVDFGDQKLKVGIYPVLDFADGRKVDHVRLVARAKGDEESKLTLRLARKG